MARADELWELTKAGLFDRLKKAVHSAGGNNAVSVASGVPISTLNAYLSGFTMPSLAKLASIARACGVSIDYLISGAKKEDEYLAFGIGAGLIPVRRLAFRAAAGAGAVVLQDEPTLLPLPAALIRELGLRGDTARAIEAQGDSMAPTIQDGDLVLLNVGERELRDGKIYVFTIGDEAFLKRLRRERGGLVMISDNPAFPPEAVKHGESLAIIGRVVWGGRRL